mmetsp:Transcript_3944/g.7610  ORF Transcript_3944/g.7610 Transcript_3944/m.7610 type:complete len:95 (-) Transcript_3944:198-482(-)|eukprot:CAMPEP_0184687060 /NCGR_PEP_ID=MMETSP0312-20130426/24979_1 /TAXON_ID=31354 /ORGANISM="Compsopogon coeruleus, Strain SAG 36.94" /LENGTH=94 /DNA_ID=CAMNT_0027142771 /DNA_START=630 /DNA_END=914 /DNA_ORIENTATION=-
MAGPRRYGRKGTPSPQTDPWSHHALQETIEEGPTYAMEREVHRHPVRAGIQMGCLFSSTSKDQTRTTRPPPFESQPLSLTNNTNLEPRPLESSL